MKRSLRVRLKSEEVKDEKFFKELCNKRKRRVHVRWHFLATTEGGCNIIIIICFYLKLLLLLPGVLGVYESVFVFLRGTVPGVIFFHASHLYSAEALSMVSERPQGVAHSFS